MLSRNRRVLLNNVTMRPIQMAYDLNNVTVEELEQLCYGQGYSYAVNGDVKAAVLTTPRADEDVYLH